jgi:hypothetical protein
MMEYALYRQTFLLNIMKGQYVTDIANAICTRTLAGNLSLWSVTANASSLGKSGRVEAGMKHKSF